MKRMSRFAAVALMAATPATIAAQSTAVDCASYVDLQTISSFALPGAVDAVAARCRSSLGPKAYLRTSAAGLSARLRASGKSWEEASPAFTRISRLTLGSNLGGEFVSGAVVDQLVSSGVAEAFEPSSCSQIDSGIAALATLPTSRMVDFLATLFVMVSADMNLKMCPAP
ncbi:MAG: hypothetical protein JWL91_1240 [Sphingomonas bacterium]|jgi:hypothetical protein|nr:hypothetical protein [Sphingomonas bacterium]